MRVHHMCMQLLQKKQQAPSRQQLQHMSREKTSWPEPNLKDQMTHLRSCTIYPRNHTPDMGYGPDTLLRVIGPKESLEAPHICVLLRQLASCPSSPNTALLCRPSRKAFQLMKQNQHGAMGCVHSPTSRLGF